MGLFEHFPYTNFHSLNIQWAIDKIKELLQQGETLYAQLQEWKTDTTTDLENQIEAWKNDIYSTFDGMKTDAEAAQAAALAAQLASETAANSAQSAAASAMLDALTITNLSTGLNASKLNRPVINPDGTAGQILYSSGDGNTEWRSPGAPSYEDTLSAVSDWLSDHPEAVTTVENGSVTKNKFADGVYPFVTPEMFGATPGTDETIPVRDAIYFASEHDSVLVLLRMYDMSIGMDTFVDLPANKGLTIIGVGYTSGVRRLQNTIPSGTTTSAYAALAIRPAANNTVPVSVALYNLTLDGNYRDQADFIAGASTGENCATFRYPGRATSPSSLIVRDVNIIDSVGDGISTQSTANGAISRAVFDNISAERTHRPYERSDICLIAYPLEVVISNCNLTKLKFEYATAPTTPTALYIDSTHIRESFTILSSSEFTVSALNSVFLGKYTLYRISGNFTACTFTPTVTTEQLSLIAQPNGVVFEGCTFNNDNNSNIKTTIAGYWGGTGLDYDSHFTMMNCEINGEITIRQSRTTKDSLIKNCVFRSSRYGVNLYYFNGMVLEDCTFYATHAIHAIAITGNSATVTLRGVIYCSGFLTRLESAATGFAGSAVLRGPSPFWNWSNSVYAAPTLSTGRYDIYLESPLSEYTANVGVLSGAVLHPRLEADTPAIIDVLENYYGKPSTIADSGNVITH